MHSFRENDPTLNKLINELIAANKDKNKQSIEVNKLRKSLGKIKRYLTNEFYKAEAKKINMNAQNCQIKQMYENAKSRQIRGNKPKCSDAKICLFFKKHFNPENDRNFMPNEILKLPDFMKSTQLLNAKILEYAIEAGEIKKIIKNLKSN